MNLIKALNLTINFQEIQEIEEHVKLYQRSNQQNLDCMKLQENNLVSSTNKLQREGLETYRLRRDLALTLRDLNMSAVADVNKLYIKKDTIKSV